MPLPLGSTLDQLTSIQPVKQRDTSVVYDHPDIKSGQAVSKDEDKFDLQLNNDKSDETAQTQLLAVPYSISNLNSLLTVDSLSAQENMSGALEQDMSFVLPSLTQLQQSNNPVPENFEITTDIIDQILNASEFTAPPLPTVVRKMNLPSSVSDDKAVPDKKLQSVLPQNNSMQTEGDKTKFTANVIATDTVSQSSVINVSKENNFDTLNLSEPAIEIETQTPQPLDNNTTIIPKSLSAQETLKPAAPVMPTPVVPQHVQQIAVDIKGTSLKESKEITVQLKPENLGKVVIKLEMAPDGRSTVVVATQYSDTLDSFKRNTVHLMNALNNNEDGLNLTEDSFTFQHQQSNQDNLSQDKQSLSDDLQPLVKANQMLKTVTQTYKSTHNGFFDEAV